MQFTSGQLIIHPHHGPATVEETFTRVVGGAERAYVQFRVRRSDLTVSVPVETAEEIGVREVLSSDQLQEVLDVLQAPSAPLERLFSRRMKDQTERLLLGDLRTTAAVVRDLVRRDVDKGLSPAEKDLLKKARGPLLGEFVESLGVSEEQADALLVAAVTGADVPTPAELSQAG